MKAGEIDMSEYPLVTLRFADKEPEGTELEEFFEQLDRELEARSGPYVTKSYGNSKFISGEARVKFGKLSQKITDKYEGRFLGSVVVLNSLIGRMMLKGVLLVLKKKTPTKVVSNEEEARVAVEQMLQEAAVTN